MRASKVTRETLQSAATEVGVRLECDAIGRQFRVKLYPETRDEMYKPACKRCRECFASRQCRCGQGSCTCGARQCRCRRYTDERGDAKYQRQSASMYGNDRRVHAVCWHGFRDFFRAVYRQEPNAKFVTAMDTWKNSEDFEERFRETGFKNIGSMMCPVAAAEACRCPDSGRVDNPERISSFDTYGADEADGAACRAMANALRAR